MHAIGILTLAIAMQAATPAKSLTNDAGWHCGAPRTLATDSAQTVRVCEVKR